MTKKNKYKNINFSEGFEKDPLSLDEELYHFNLKLNNALAIDVPCEISQETLKFSFEDFEDFESEELTIQELEIEEYLSERPHCQACGDFVETDNGSLICYGCLPNEVKSFIESIK